MIGQVLVAEFFQVENLVSVLLVVDSGSIQMTGKMLTGVMNEVD